METIFDINHLKSQICDLEADVSQDSFWDENASAQKIFSNLSAMKKKLSEYSDLKESFNELQTYLDLFVDGVSDSDLEQEAKVLFDKFKDQVDRLSLLMLFNQKYDNFDCILSIVSGAGGTDAQDWTQMLSRMYTRFFEKQSFKYEMVDFHYGDEAGLKDITFVVSGDYAYGKLINEKGVHRLVRQSPFNANNKRQTSFASVDVIPQINNDNINLTIDPKELRIDTFRSSGAGGQHVNKTDSAVRITHIPSGIVASSQNSRSQGANKDVAMNLLMSRLMILKEQEQKDQLDEIRGELTQISWGNQIRSYVFHPYKLVKDLRTQLERRDIQSIMDGDLDGFIEENLKKRVSHEK